MKKDVKPNGAEDNLSKKDIDKILTVNAPKRKFNLKWPLTILIITLVLAFALGLVSEIVLASSHSVVGLIISFVVLLVLLVIAVAFDMMGVAVTAANIEPFNAMSSKKIRGAKEGVKIIQNAEKFSSFACDIIGDICGILSGGVGASVVAYLVVNQEGMPAIIVASLVSAIISALTVFGKGIGKNIAITQSNKIVFGIGKFVALFHKNKNK